MPLKPDSNAGTLTRFGSGQLIEPCRYRCIRVMQNSLDCAVDDGLLDATANIVAMDMNPLVLDLLRDGELPEDISEEDATETWRIARAQRDICLCRLSIAQLNHALPESEKGWSTGSSGLS